MYVQFSERVLMVSAQFFVKVKSQSVDGVIREIQLHFSPKFKKVRRSGSDSGAMYQEQCD
jgi:hypothetical protein